MGIVLSILKIIGIVLLVILLLLVLIIGLVLFVPVRYNLHALYYGEADVKAGVSWLLHIFSVKLFISGKVKKCVIKVFGIPVFDLFNQKEKESSKKEKKKKRIKKSDKKEKAVHTVDEKKARKEQTLNAEKQVKKVSKTEKNQKKEVQKNQTINNDDSMNFFEKMIKMFQMLIIKIKNLYNNGIQTKEKLEKWIIVLKREKTKKAIDECKDILILILKEILPRKWNLNVHFGFDDPSTTGQIVGYYWMFIGLLANHVYCFPDFDKKVFEGELKAKGHIRVFTFVRVAWKFFFSPRLKYLRKIKSEVDAL